jgi:hypothetical protein
MRTEKPSTPKIKQLRAASRKRSITIAADKHESISHAIHPVLAGKGTRFGELADRVQEKVNWACTYSCPLRAVPRLRDQLGKTAEKPRPAVQIRID